MDDPNPLVVPFSSAMAGESQGSMSVVLNVFGLERSRIGHVGANCVLNVLDWHASVSAKKGPTW